MLVIKFLAPFFLLTTFTSAKAEIIPLNCRDYVALTESTAYYRDKYVPLKSTLKNLGSDDFMSQKDRKIVHNMISRVYKQADKNEAEHKAISRSECNSKLLKR